MNKTICLVLLFSIVFLSSCTVFTESTPGIEPDTVINIDPVNTENQNVTAETPQMTPSPTAYLSMEDLLEILPSEEPQPTEVSQHPLALDFPTPVPTDSVDWRPPLYEIPWAPGPQDHFYFVRPIAVNTVNWPLPDYRYGITFFAPDIVHTGIDIAAPRGTPVLAAGSGRVVWAGTGLYFGRYNPDDPYGQAVVIEHDFGYEGNQLFTVYAHMDRIDINLGDSVATHDPIGQVGDTGFTTGPHLHFEIRTGSNNFFQTRNPELWIAPPQGWGVLVGRVLTDSGGPIEKLDLRIYSIETSRVWHNYTYTMLGIRSDPYYGENFVLSDLPAGDYEVSFTYKEESYKQVITINPGVVSFFQFRPKDGFTFTPPGATEAKTITP
jgi:murein DD-endopeptidase MepM/ murein hydrolase activator NlpD